MSQPWRLFVDTGGTFTDCLAVAPDGALHRAKVLSSGVVRRRRPDGAIETLDTGLEAPIVAAHAVTGTPFGAPLPPIALRLATTRGTNALLTRSGRPPALFVTAGFGDLLAIGTQQRPELFARDIVRPAPLYGPVVEVPERLAADGSVLRALDEAAVRAAAERLLAGGVTTAAVALLHAFAHPDHERRVAALLREAGFTQVSVSAELSPFVKLVPRAQTAVVDAYLAPVLNAYLEGVSTPLLGRGGQIPFHVLTSAGGLVRAESFRARDSLLSGPAGGVVGAARAARRAGFSRAIAFDMGGTSTDVARIEGETLDYVFEHGIGDAWLTAPALAIESVAAGGGSICSADSRGRLRVGPESAGARPGPACYGMGGPLTVTDVNLLLGRLDPAQFEIPVDIDAARARFDELHAALGGETNRQALLQGLLELADEAMADAIRRISVRRGYDPADYALIAFGGAGGVHAASVAAKLKIRTVLVPPDAGLLSALGLAHAALERFAERQVLRPLASVDTDALLATLADEASAAVIAEGAAPETITLARRIARLRLAGQETPLEIEAKPGVSLGDAFAERFATIYGYRPDPSRAVEVESLRVVAASPSAGLPESPLVERAGLRAGETVDGPRVLAEPHATTFVPEGWTATLDEVGTLVVTSSTSAISPSPAARAPLPPRKRDGDGNVAGEVVALELFTRRFESVAAEMGEQLRRTALSVNVKERLDYSCALLGPDGDLVATAAHIPVHLGALGACVRRLREAGALEGDASIVTNHPAFGGSHLPDVTVVTPVRDDAGALLGYVASRAHHAEIGGTRPGSTPPDATTLAQEGVCILPTPFDRETLRRLLTEASHPTRALADNLADLEAQIAANRRGADALRALAAAHGPEILASMRAALADRSEALVRDALKTLADETRTAVERLDDGAQIAVSLTIAPDGRARVDFTGTSPTHSGNLNAPPAVTTAAVLYALRLLVDEDLPLNEGMLRAVELILPPATLLNPIFSDDPDRCPAVVGGNTEVSQKVASALVAALGLAAGSQGTMNNVLFGDETFGYYETVCGGAGATPNADGASAVHTHMTNTRITDPEILETRYPVRLERFALRRGSGGPGRHRGGDGVIREYVFLKPLSLSLLAQSRVWGPCGAEGGSAGLPGRDYVIPAGEEPPSGTLRTGGGHRAEEVRAGDRLVLETPGGGGWGLPDPLERLFPPSADAFLDRLRAEITDADLETIARADYGAGFDEHLAALRSIRDTGRIPARLPWEPKEVLELTQWGLPNDRHGHRVRAFACAVLLRAYGDIENDGYFGGENGTLAIALESARFLGTNYEQGLGRSVAWLLAAPSIYIERVFFIYALLLLATPELDQEELLRLTEWMDEAESRWRADPWEVSSDENPPYLLGLTVYDLRHSLWRKLTRERLDTLVNRPPGPGRDALANLLAKVLG